MWDSLPGLPNDYPNPDHYRDITAGLVMRRRLFLHAGMAKAGSSAIQIALLNQELALKKSNILNPVTGRRRGAHWDLQREIGDATQSRLFETLSAEARDYPFTVISCEAFWLLTDDGLQRLHEATRDWDVHVILYLRRPHDYLGSSYRQHIKSGKTSETAQKFVNRVEHRLAYDVFVDRWSRAFPLTVRVYDVVRSGIESDFFQLIGAGHLKPERLIVNGTPADGATKIMLAANRCISRRSIRRRINKKVLASQKYLSWMTPIDNTVFNEAGLRAAAAWDREVLLRFLTHEELTVLTDA